MNIGVVGAGRLGFGMGSLWAEKGHQVCFSHSRSQAKLESTVVAAGINATLCTPEAAAQFGRVVLLAIHWPQVPRIVGELRPHLNGKPLLTCVVPWNASRDGLSVGTDNSAGEEIARLAPEAHVVEALPLLADGLYSPTNPNGSDRGTLFYCGNDPSAKDVVAQLIEDLGMQPLDAGDLVSARYLEPTMALLWHLAMGKGGGTDIALKLLPQ